MLSRQHRFLNSPRLRTRDHHDAESGSLILDILIGMAIFALIAIIAISAIGQYRMRAYTQTAASDAETLSLAIQAAITDKAGDPDADAYPTGPLSDADLAALEVSPSGRGAQKAAAVVIPDPTNAEAFTVCVEYRGAYAEYGSEAGLTASGDAAKDGYLGCEVDTTPPPVPAGIPCPEFNSAYALYKGYSAYIGHRFDIYPVLTNQGGYRLQSRLDDVMQHTTWAYTLSDLAPSPYDRWSRSMAQTWGEYTFRYRSPDSADVSAGTCTASVRIDVTGTTWPAANAFPVDTRFDLGTTNGVTLSMAP